MAAVAEFSPMRHRHTQATAFDIISPLRSGISPLRCMISPTRGTCAELAESCDEFSSSALVRASAYSPPRINDDMDETPTRDGNSQRVMPKWLQNFGCPCAVLCACLAGIVPILGIAVVTLFDDSGMPSPSPVGPAPETRRALSAPGHDDYESGEAPAASRLAVATETSQLRTQIFGTLDSIRQELQDQERSRRLASTALDTRMNRMEDSIAHVQAAAEGASAAVAKTSLPTSPGTSHVEDPVANLGVDWAAWSSGAEIDHGRTVGGLGRGPLGRAERAVAGALPRYAAYVGDVSPPADVVLAADSAQPSKCFTFPGSGTIAIRLGRAVAPTHVAIEQRPAWATLHPDAAPRHFKVRVWSDTSASDVGSLELGSFEYDIHGRRLQVFALPQAPSARAIEFVFSGSWGSEFTTVCRLRVFAPSPSVAR